MAEKQITLEQGMEALVSAWNQVTALPQGPRLLHRLFGHAIPGGPATGGRSFSTLINGTARTIGAEEQAMIPVEIARVREEAEQAARHARGED